MQDPVLLKGTVLQSSWPGWLSASQQDPCTVQVSHSLLRPGVVAWEQGDASSALWPASATLGACRASQPALMSLPLDTASLQPNCLPPALTGWSSVQQAVRGTAQLGFNA